MLKLLSQRQKAHKSKNSLVTQIAIIYTVKCSGEKFILSTFSRAEKEVLKEYGYAVLHI